MKKIFISYSRKNAANVDLLVKEMKARGLRPWRDLDDLAYGTLMEPEIRDALEKECQGCLLYITPESLASDFVTQVEMKQALEQVKPDGLFALVPIFHGVSIEEVSRALKPHAGIRITNLSGVVIPATATGEELRKEFAGATRKLLKAVMQRETSKFEAEPAKSFIIDFLTYKTRLGGPEADLVVDWSGFVKDDGTLESNHCTEILWPALQDIESVVAETIRPRTVLLRPKAFPSCGLAFGFAFRATTGFKLEIEQPFPDQRVEHWTTAVTQKVQSPLSPLILPDKIAGKEASLEVSIYGKSAIALEDYVATLSDGLRVKAFIRPAQDRVDIENSDQASAIANQVVDTIRQLRGNYTLLKLHLALAGPIALTVQIGYRLNALGPIQLYDKTRTAAEKYVPTFLISS